MPDFQSNHLPTPFNDKKGVEYQSEVMKQEHDVSNVCDMKHKVDSIELR